MGLIPKHRGQLGDHIFVTPDDGCLVIADVPYRWDPVGLLEVGQVHLQNVNDEEESSLEALKIHVLRH